MSLTNDQITAKNFKEFYEAIRPYLNGSFPTPIANKFDKANMYSTDEQIVGRWIDGKPLYQRVLHLPDETAANAKVTYDHGISDIENVVKCNGTANYMAGGTTANPMAIPFLELDGANLTNSARAVLSCDKIRIQFTAYNFSFGFHDIYAVIQYTKTTDTAMDIGSDTDYSTTEKIIGTWIDGKPLYQKTIVFDNVQSATDGNLVHNISNVDYISISDASYKLNQLYMTAYCDAIENGSLSANFSYSFVCQYADATKIRYQCGANKSGGTLYITIQYTKTTD